MLVSGVRPPRQGIKTIPRQAMQLLDEGFAATQPQMLRARCVLEEWIEDRNYDREDGGTLFEADPTPSRFVEWCDESFSPKLRSMRPLWLEQFVFVALGSGSNELPPPISSELVDEMRALLHKGASQRDVPASPEVAEPAVKQHVSVPAWNQFDRWLQDKSVASAKAVIGAALRELPLDERVKFPISEVQLRINDFARKKSCRHLSKRITNGGKWAFVHLTPDGTDICTRAQLEQILGRWRDKYREFERQAQPAH